MRVLMLGWEFPPTIHGGLGTACAGLVRALDHAGVDVTFVLPRDKPPSQPPSPNTAPPRFELADRTAEHVEFANVRFVEIPVALSPYQTTPVIERQDERRRGMLRPAESSVGDVGPDATGDPAQPVAETGLFGDVRRYTELVERETAGAQFDVIHAHDWMTFPAAMAIAGRTGKPFVAHVHSTETDRGGEHAGDPRIADIERRGLHAAVRVVAVSQYTKRSVEHQYGVAGDKIDVVYNAVEPPKGHRLAGNEFAIRGSEKIVLFLGRITSQKGPEYFLTAARKVLEVMDDVKFVMAGGGDMARYTVELAATFGIAHKVLFTGFLRGLDVERIFQIADLFVMPSVSEPFGIASLEAVTRGVPTIISNQSGVGEVLRNALKVDFWDTNELANKMVSVLRRPTLAEALREAGGREVAKLTWAAAAEGCLAVYDHAIAAMPTARPRSPVTADAGGTRRPR